MRQSEMLVFDNGRLKQATYDTDQGFGLRAVKDEAVGYAHSSDLSEAALARAADAVRAVKGGYSGRYADAAAAHQPAALRRREPARRARVRDQGAAAGDHRRLCAGEGPARAAGLGLVRRELAGGRNPARRRRDLSRRAPAGAGQRLGRRRRRRPAGIRQPRHRRTRGLRALPRHPRLAGHRRRGAAPGAHQSRGGAGAGRRDGRGARPRLAGRHAARGGRATGSKATSTARRPRPSPA